MSIMTVETRVTRQYLERKTKSDLVQWLLECLDEIERLRKLALAVPTSTGESHDKPQGGRHDS